MLCWPVTALELEASAEQTARPSMSDPDVQFCIYMVKKHGDNYVVRFVVLILIMPGYAVLIIFGACKQQVMTNSVMQN